MYFTGQPASPFEIDPDTGSVYLTKDLTRADYRDKSSFTLNVSATDDGSCCTPGEIYSYSPMIHKEYFSPHCLKIEHVQEYPIMHCFGIARHAQSMVAYGFLPQYSYEFPTLPY